MLKDRFARFSTLLIATRSLSIKLTLWVRLLTVSFIPSSLRSFSLWYPTRALFTSSKKLWRYRISWSGNKSSCGIQLKTCTRQAGQQHWTTITMSTYWSKLLFLLLTIDRQSPFCPSTLNCSQFTPSGTVWPQLDRRGKEGRDYQHDSLSGPRKLRAWELISQCLPHLLARKPAGLLTETLINLICQNKTTVETIPITELAHVAKP